MGYSQQMQEFGSQANQHLNFIFIKRTHKQKLLL